MPRPVDASAARSAVGCASDAAEHPAQVIAEIQQMARNRV